MIKAVKAAAAVTGLLDNISEARHALDGSLYVRFDFVPDSKEEDTVSCIAFDEIALYITTYCARGEELSITGTIKTARYTDSFGNKVEDPNIVHVDTINYPYPGE